ncbi:DUF4097 family beta strand repeat protein [bacterium]|nr:DUF4097 family beta strand repeat protein [bacterium]
MSLFARSVKLFWIGLTLWVTLGIMSCSVSDSLNMSLDASAIEHFSYQVPADKIVEFEIGGINGDIEITGTDCDSIEIWGDRVVRSDTQTDADDHLSLLQVKVRTSDSVLSVKTEQPNESNRRSYEVDYHVRLPRSLTVTAASINGDLIVLNMTNAVKAELVNGEVDCQNIRGSCLASIVNGEIHCEMILPDQGYCILAAVNGDIALETMGVFSAVMEAQVTNGSIFVDGLEVHQQRISKTTFYGVVGNGSGSIQLQTVNGDIKVTGK